VPVVSAQALAGLAVVVVGRVSHTALRGWYKADGVEVVDMAAVAVV
jgi:hypothetical protein